jgi:TPR repeat protein
MLVRVLLIAATVLAFLGRPALAQAPAQAAGLGDNGESIAVVIGNKSYRQTVPVDFAHNDADAMRDYLVRSLGFRDTNVFVLKDATLNEFNQVFGTERNPQSGRLWRSVREGRSNVFVYFSGHGVPDLASRQPFLLPHDGDPNQGESGFLLETLYRNLELVKQKIGPERRLIVMIDACFTGETGRKGETLLAVSAPGFAPARPKAASNGLIKIVATSGAHPANWDEANRLGLLTSRFLMGVAGLADERRAGADATGNGDGVVQWSELQAYLKDEVETAARRETGREQVPEVDMAALNLKVDPPVPGIARGVAVARDEASWRRAEAAGTREAYEAYIGACREVCAHRQEALARLGRLSQGTLAKADEENWQRLSRDRRYQEYLDSCGQVCAYRDVAQGYLGTVPAEKDPRVGQCDDLAAAVDDPDKPKGVKGRRLTQVNGFAAVEACRAAAAAHPNLRRLNYQLGRAYDKLERHKEAFSAYKAAADAGSVAALNNLGTLYEGGRGVKASLPEALKLYEEAGKKGNVLAMSNAGRMLQFGRGVPKDEAAALRWYHQAADAGDAASLSKLVPYYLNGGPGIPKNPKKGIELHRRAADQGDPASLATMAVMIDNGYGMLFPGRKSVEVAQQALKQGEMGAAALAATDMAVARLKPDTIRALQRAMQKEHFYPGAIDGRFNPVFVRALDQYARSKAEQAD